MATSCIDYFATLGVGHGQQLLCKNMLSSILSDKPVHPSIVWNSAITDINIIFYDNDDEIPDDDEDGNFPVVVIDGLKWELLKYTVDGELANCHTRDPSKGIAYFAVRRRCVTQRLDHITEIVILHRGDPVPDGFEIAINSLLPETLVENSQPSSRIAVKRASADSNAYFHGKSIIDDICLVNATLGEEPPSDYIFLEKSLNTATLSNLRLSVERIHMIYRHRPAMGLCDLPFEALTLDRYPMLDHPDFPLPATELPVFVFPHSLKLKHQSKSNFPLPNFFTFVFTDVKGRHLYTACLRFYELIPFELVNIVAKTIYGDDVRIPFTDSGAFFCPKVICVVSQFPFYRAMGRYLKQLYSLSLSSTFCPLEYFISSVVSRVPLPIEGGRPFHVVLDASLISATSRSMPPICFDLPSKYSFPQMDVDFAGPMRCLSTDHLLAIFALLLRESKVVFICCSNALLTEVMETFRCLLYPLIWSSCFITRLPDSLSGVLQAPGGFMIGMHVTNSQENDINELNVDGSSHRMEEENINIGSHRFGADHDWIQNLQSGTFIADLTQNRIYLYENKKTELLSSSRTNQILKSLPSGSFRKLQLKIQQLADKYSLCPQKFEEVGLSQFDSAFDFAGDPKRNSKDFPTNDIRDAFLVFMCEILGDFSRYIRPPDLTAIQGATFKELFKIEDYLRDADKSVRIVLGNLLETQMFAYLIQQRLEEPTLSSIFFDQAVRVLTNLCLNSISGDKRTNAIPTLDRQAIMLSEKDAETPLYELVGCFNELANAFSLSRKPPTLTDIIAKRRRQYHQRSNSLESHGSYDSELGSPKVMLDRRQELAQARHGLDLQLDDMGKGPLIISGPSKIEDPYLSELPQTSSEDPEEEEEEEEEGERRSSIRYRYNGGWPDLDVSLLNSLPKNSQHGLEILRTNRIKSLKQIDPQYQLFIRPRIYRICYQSYGSLLHSVQMDMKVESKAAVSNLLEIYSNSLLLLSIRCMRGVNQIGSILQCMAILLHLEQHQLLRLLDDSIWRSLFVACSAITEESFSHKAICSLFAALRSCHLNVDAIVSTLYFRSFSKLLNPKKKSNEEDHSPHTLFLDPFHHLEQLGVTWMMQKLSIPQSDLTTPQGSDKHLSLELLNKSQQQPPSGIGFWDRFRGKKKVSQGQGSEETNSTHQSYSKQQQQHELLQLQSQHFSTLPSDLTKILQLSRSDVLFGLRRPRNLLIATLPIKTTPQEFPNLDQVVFNDQTLESRVVELQELYEQFHEPHHLRTTSKAITELETKESGDTPLPTIGKFEIAIAAVKGVATQPNISIKNIYVRCWLSTNAEIRLKSQPNLSLVTSESKSTFSSLSSLFDPNDFLAFHSVRPKNITVYFEVFGDFLRAQESSCYAFDQSLGIGTIQIEKISEGLAGNWIKLSYSTVGDKVIQIELFVSTKFLPQEDSKSFFGNRKENFRGKSQSFSPDSPKETVIERIPSRESEGARPPVHSTSSRFSWTKITSVFSLNKSNRESTASSTSIPETVHEEATQEPSINETNSATAEEEEDLPVAPVTPPLVAAVENEEDVLERKSKKWRDSLAMLTGELDLNDFDPMESSEPNSEDLLRSSLRRSVESVRSQDSSDQEGTGSRPCSMDLSSLTPTKIQKKRLSVSAHPLGFGDLVADSTLMDDGPTQQEQEQEQEKESEAAIPGPTPVSTSESVNSAPTETKPLAIETLNQENISISDGSTPNEQHSSTSYSSLGRTPVERGGENSSRDQAQHLQREEGSIATEVAGSVKSEYQNVQHIADIQSHFIRPLERCGLGIYSMTPCGHCGHTLLDEEVMAIWGGFCDHPKDMTCDLFSSHVITCPLCKSDILPKLHIQLYKLIPLASHSHCSSSPPSPSAFDLVEETSQLECLWQTEVRHLSPFGLRLLTEHVLEQEGFVIAEAEWMVRNHPDIYWNSLWYSTRLNLPNGFYSSNDLSSIIASIPKNKIDPASTSTAVQSPFIWVSPIAISWRECVMRAKIRRILLDEHSEGILTLKDVFPGITREDQEVACEIINAMNGSVGNLASSLLRINQLSSIWTLFSGTKGRKLYLALISLIHFYHPSCLLQYSPEIPHGLSKGTQFDRALIEALSIAFTQKDFEVLHTKETELNLATSHRAAQAIRIALGYLS